MKRLIVSAIVVVAFVLYAIVSRGETGTQTVNTADVVASTSSSGSTTASSVYKDGTYTGSQANTVYGTVQVEAVVAGGQITDVTFLSYPTGREESDQINGRAIPVLTQEAIAAQSANVQVVSGATLTSNAFMKSLQSALDQAQS